MSTINAQLTTAIGVMEVGIKAQQQMLEQLRGLVPVEVPQGVDPEVAAMMQRYGVNSAAVALVREDQAARRQSAAPTSKSDADKIGRRPKGEAEARILHLLTARTDGGGFTRDDLASWDVELGGTRPLEEWALNNALLKMVRAGVLCVVKPAVPGHVTGKPAEYELASMPAQETPVKARPPRTEPVDVTVRTAPPQFVQGKSAHGNESECTLAMRAAVEALDAEFTMAGLVRQMELMEGNHRVGKWTNAGAVGNQVNYWRTYDVLKIVRREEPHMVAVFVKGPKWEGD